MVFPLFESENAFDIEDLVFRFENQAEARDLAMVTSAGRITRSFRL
jgi:hypothetical protein